MVVTGEVAQQSAGFLNQQAACGHVPFSQTEFPEGVIAAGGDVGQIEAGGAAAANAGGMADQAAEHAQVVVQRLGLVFTEREAGAEQGAFQALACTDAQALAVQCGAAAAAGGEFFLAYRVQNHGMLDAALDAAGNADGEMRYAAQEVGGAVQWVDDPDDVSALAVAGLEARFFGMDAVIRISLAELLDDDLFRSPIHFADVVVSFFLADGQDIQPFHGAINQFSGAARGAQGDVQHGLHTGASLNGSTKSRTL